MVARMLGALVVLHSVLLPAGCCRKTKETKMGPSYHPHPNDTLPADVQVTVWLPKGETRRFFYTSTTDGGALSLTLTPCATPVLWSFAADNATAPAHSIAAAATRHLPPAAGVFTLSLAAPNDTFVLVYVSTEPGGPQALQNARLSKVKVLRRQKGKRMTVKWNPSLVDPQGTDYCLVTATAPLHTTLCAAQLAPHHDSTVTCVGRKTHHTITDLKQGQKYFFSIFATNHQSNFTYPYGSTSAVFDGRFRPTSLKDGKATFVNLKDLDGKAVFRYKVGKNSTKRLDLFILPCGGVVEVEVTLKDKKVVPATRVESFGRIAIDNPVVAARYYVKIFALNREELKKTSGVEIYATTKYPAKIPLPSMPQTLKVTEYTSLRTCDSVTVAWIAAPSQKSFQHCLSAKEGKIRELDEYRMPNQCGLENRLKKSTDFAVRYCIDVRSDKESLVVHKLGQLKPGRHYIVQVTVKKPKGKTLSYDLLQVRTKPSCKKKN